jgi:hypothetical protein
MGFGSNRVEQKETMGFGSNLAEQKVLMHVTKRSASEVWPTELGKHELF